MPGRELPYKPMPGIGQERREIMPGFDGTGPRGMGPMTGGGMGYCVVPLNIQETELESLKNQRYSLKAQLGQVEAKIEYLRSKKGESTTRSG
jgi:hypothetical protein